MHNIILAIRGNCYFCRWRFSVIQVVVIYGNYVQFNLFKVLKMSFILKVAGWEQVIVYLCWCPCACSFQNPSSSSRDANECAVGSTMSAALIKDDGEVIQIIAFYSAVVWREDTSTQFKPLNREQTLTRLAHKSNRHFEFCHNAQKPRKVTDKHVFYVIFAIYKMNRWLMKV